MGDVRLFADVSKPKNCFISETSLKCLAFNPKASTATKGPLKYVKYLCYASAIISISFMCLR